MCTDVNHRQNRLLFFCGKRQITTNILKTFSILFECEKIITIGFHRHTEELKVHCVVIFESVSIWCVADAQQKTTFTVIITFL